MLRERLHLWSRAMLLTLVACAPPLVTAVSDATAPSAGAPVWPPPPAEPVIRYVRVIGGPSQWGITPGLFDRIADALTGKSEERFVRPTGVAERQGVLYVADPGAPALWIIDATQNRMTRVSRVGDAALASPVAVALGPDDSVFLADTVLKKIFRVDRAGNPVEIIAPPELARPSGLAYDPERHELYVADSSAHRIAVFGPEGRLVRTFGRRGSADGELNGPTHLALDASGALLVTDALNYRVQAFDRDGRFLWRMGRQGDGSGDFAAPKGLASDTVNHIYVVDALFDAVQVFDTKGTLLLAFGERGTREGQFSLPGGIFISPQNEIYVADSYNRRIQEFRAMPPVGKDVPK